MAKRSFICPLLVIALVLETEGHNRVSPVRQFKAGPTKDHNAIIAASTKYP